MILLAFSRGKYNMCFVTQIGLGNVDEWAWLCMRQFVWINANHLHTGPAMTWRSRRRIRRCKFPQCWHTGRSGTCWACCTRWCLPNQRERMRKWLSCSWALIMSGFFLNEQCWGTENLKCFNKKRLNNWLGYDWKGDMSYGKLNCLTLTEFPVLGDHLAIASVALTRVGTIAVYAATLSFTRVLFTLVHIYQGTM